jgi:hypothetical protein
MTTPRKISSKQKQFKKNSVTLNLIQDLMVFNRHLACAKIAGQARNDNTTQNQLKTKAVQKNSVILNLVHDLMAFNRHAACAKIAGKPAMTTLALPLFNPLVSIHNLAHQGVTHHVFRGKRVYRNAVYTRKNSERIAQAAGCTAW